MAFTVIFFVWPAVFASGREITSKGSETAQGVMLEEHLLVG